MQPHLVSVKPHPGSLSVRQWQRDTARWPRIQHLAGLPEPGQVSVVTDWGYIVFQLAHFGPERQPVDGSQIHRSGEFSKDQDTVSGREPYHLPLWRWRAVVSSTIPCFTDTWCVVCWNEGNGPQRVASLSQVTVSQPVPLQPSPCAGTGLSVADITGGVGRDRVSYVFYTQVHIPRSGFSAARAGWQLQTVLSCSSSCGGWGPAVSGSHRRDFILRCFAAFWSVPCLSGRLRLSGYTGQCTELDVTCVCSEREATVRLHRVCHSPVCVGFSDGCVPGDDWRSRPCLYERLPVGGHSLEEQWDVQGGGVLVSAVQWSVSCHHLPDHRGSLPGGSIPLQSPSFSAALGPAVLPCAVDHGHGAGHCSSAASHVRLALLQSDRHLYPPACHTARLPWPWLRLCCDDHLQLRPLPPHRCRSACHLHGRPQSVHGRDWRQRQEEQGPGGGAASLHCGAVRLPLLVPHRLAGGASLQGHAHLWGGQRRHGHLRLAAQLGVKPLPVLTQRHPGPKRSSTGTETAEDSHGRTGRCQIEKCYVGGLVSVTEQQEQQQRRQQQRKQQQQNNNKNSH